MSGDVVSARAAETPAAFRGGGTGVIYLFIYLFMILRPHLNYLMTFCKSFQFCQASKKSFSLYKTWK